MSKRSASALLASLAAEIDAEAEARLQMELGRAESFNGPPPTGDVSLDIAPEQPAEIPVNAVEVPLPGAIEPNVQAVLDENAELPLPVMAEENLPPVRRSASALLADLEVAAPEPTPAPRRSASALLADLQMEAPAPVNTEAKPLNLSFGGQEGAIVSAERGEPKKPVTTPEAADGSDVTFDAKGPAFQFTGTLVMDPSSGPEQGLDGMVPVAARGPTAATAGVAEPVLNRRPRLVPSGGQIVFDQSSPERFTQGVEEAFAAGILPQSNYEKIKASEAQIFKVVDDRRKLEEKAQADPKLLAVLQGLGRGGAMTLGAVGGAKLLATGAGAAFLASGVGAPLAPAAAVVAGTVGAIGGGIAAGVGYDAIYKKLGEHFTEYDNVMKAAELYPMHKAGGELAMAGLAIGTSVPQAVRGLQTAYQAGGLPQVARTAGAAGGLGAGTGVVAYPIDAAVRGEPVTPGGFATAAGTGALSAGFFINNRMARTPEIMRIFAKADAGSKLTAAEETIYRAAYGPLEAAVRRGQVDGQRLVDGRVEVPTTSVAGMMPAAGRARVQARYESPMRLPEGALQAARDYASRPRPVATPPAAAQTATPSVPRQAPVNVIPAGETIIPPPPMTPAMMTPDAFADAMATERGLDMDFNPEATEQLFGEHFRIVREAVNNNEPVSAAALELYEMNVPYYVPDEPTGISQFDQASFDAWQGYVSGRGQEVKQDAAEAGAVELLAAIRELGGLPAPKSGGKRAVWKGELQSLYETSRGARDLGIKGAMGLFRKDAPDVDYLVIGLREKGFRVETEADLFELLDNRLRNGRDVFAYPTMAADQFAPMGGRMGRRAPRPAPGQMDLLGERDVEFTLAGQTDRSSLTPEEMALAQRAAEEKAQADALQGDLFGEKAAPTQGFEAMAQRITNAEQRFIEFAMESAGLTQEQAGAALAKYKEVKAIKIDPVGGQFAFVDGGFAEPGVLRRAAGIKSDAEDVVATDPLTVPPQFKAAGGGAKVPPGTPAGTAPAAGVPDWVLQPGETSDGRRLIRGIENFQPGQRWGYQTIVDFVNKAVNVEMRYSRSQTSATHPAHYKPAQHMGFTRDKQSQIVFHEAGHGLEELLRSRAPGAITQFATELIGLTQRPGSMASDPPASASPAVKQDYRIGEGIAEWTRLLMVDPSSVQGLKFTAAVDEMTAASFPKLAKALRDGARAVNAFQQKPAAMRLMMFDAMPNANPTANEVIGGMIRMGEGFLNSLSSGSRINKVDRALFRATMKNRKQMDMTYQQALDRARQVRQKYTDPLLQAYNMILSIGQETQLAISGKGASKGLRVIGPDGKFQYFTREAWVDLRHKVPASKLAEFDNAAYALEALSRWKAKRIEYKGMREGLTPDQLELIVKQARVSIRDFDQRFAEQSAWFDAVVDLKDFGRLLKPGERDKIVETRDTYWPLPAAMTAGRGRGGRGRGNITTGMFRARGHSGPTRQVDEVAAERARTAFEAYYWNRFGLTLYKNMLKVSADRTLPIEARAMAGAQMVMMKMPQAVAATVSKEEVIPWVIEAIKDQMEAALGFRPELKASDINLSWNFKDVWRPTKPGDINVVSLLVDGERRYFQLGDPAIFGMFSNPQVAGKTYRFLSWALGPGVQNWKRNITQTVPFAIWGLIRDMFSQTVLNPDAIGWYPGGAHVLGVVNKFTKKYPQVFQEGLLLSRVQPTETELITSVKHGAIWQWLSEGFYVSQAKDPTTKLLATLLQPSNLLFPLWKLADVVNLVAPGAAFGGMVAGPVGAAVGAVVGPLVGFSGQNMAAFFETAGREGAAVSVLNRGGTDEEALLKYWTASGQFNEHAGVADARVVMGIPGFLNPMYQGTRNALQKLSDPDPKVSGTAWARMTLIIPLLFSTAAVAAYLSMQRKDRDRERQRPVVDRMNFMDLNGFKVPFPYGPEGVVATLVYNSVMDDLLGRPAQEAEKTSLMLIKRVFDLGSPLQFLGPQFAAITEAQMNWSNFRQQHIVAPWMVRLSASEQYYSTTPEFYQKLGQMFDYSPAKLQYIVQQGVSRQADEMVRMLESLDGGRPVQEMADVPFVGRMFVRDPIGFGSQAVRDASATEDRLTLLSNRLQAKGYGTLGLFDKAGNPEYPADRLNPDLQKLQVQLQYLQGLRQGLRTLDELQAMGKAYAKAQSWNNERNVRRMQTDLTQAVMIGNRDRIQTIDQAIELLKQIDAAPPEAQAADYLERRF